MRKTNPESGTGNRPMVAWAAMAFYIGELYGAVRYVRWRALKP